MTPQEKANDLVQKYLLEVRGADRYNYNLEEMNVFIAKQCAKIAVEEAEKSEYNVLTKFGFVTENYTSDYWQLVKDGIERL